MKLYNVDWKDANGNIWKDCVIQSVLIEMQNNPKITIIKSGFRTEI